MAERPATAVLSRPRAKPCMARSRRERGARWRAALAGRVLVRRGQG